MHRIYCLYHSLINKKCSLVTFCINYFLKKCLAIFTQNKQIHYLDSSLSMEIFDIKRVVNMTSGGKVESFVALIAVGNGKKFLFCSWS